MSDKEVVEVIYSKTSKYEITKQSSSRFYVWKNGKPHRGYFSSLQKAVEAIEEEKRKYGT